MGSCRPVRLVDPNSWVRSPPNTQCSRDAARSEAFVASVIDDQRLLVVTFRALINDPSPAHGWNHLTSPAGRNGLVAAAAAPRTVNVVNLHPPLGAAHPHRSGTFRHRWCGRTWVAGVAARTATPPVIVRGHIKGPDGAEFAPSRTVHRLDRTRPTGVSPCRPTSTTCAELLACRSTTSPAPTTNSSGRSSLNSPNRSPSRRSSRHGGRDRVSHRPSHRSGGRIVTGRPPHRSASRCGSTPGDGEDQTGCASRGTGRRRSTRSGSFPPTAKRSRRSPRSTVVPSPLSTGNMTLCPDADEIDVVLPPTPLTDRSTTWSAAGCQRRCDGVTASVMHRRGDDVDYEDAPCLCLAAGALSQTDDTAHGDRHPPGYVSGCGSQNVVIRPLPAMMQMVALIEAAQSRGWSPRVAGRETHPAGSNRAFPAVPDNCPRRDRPRTLHPGPAALTAPAMRALPRRRTRRPRSSADLN